MLETIVRHMEMGKNRMQAALDGAKEVGFTIISMTFSLVAIFIPLFFLGGMMGRLFREFAVTIGVAVLVSGVISLTLTPMLASRFSANRTSSTMAESIKPPKQCTRRWSDSTTKACSLSSAIA